eukprot:Polyplicarium_translucidae@DN2738_c0_g1_i10.p1
MHRPAHFVALDGFTSSIVVSLRGTTEVGDVFTDAACKTENGSHRGMKLSAKNMDKKLKAVVLQLLQENPTFDVIVVGHSMGGGVASLLTLKWCQDADIVGEDRRRTRVHGYAFAPPCVVQPEVAQSSIAQEHITSVVYGMDITSRASIGSVHRLQQVVLQLCGRPDTRSPAGFGVRRSGDIELIPVDTDRTQLPSMDESTRCLSRSASLPEDLDRWFEPNDGGDGFRTPSARSDGDAHASPSFFSAQQSLEERGLSPGPSPIRSPSTHSASPELLDFSPHSDPENGVFGAEHLMRIVRDFRHRVAGEPCNAVVQYRRERLKTVLRQLRGRVNTAPREVLTPAGTAYLVLPAEDLRHTGLTFADSSHLTFPGRCAIMRIVDLESLCKEVLLLRRAFSDHVPSHLAHALGMVAQEAPGAEEFVVTLSAPPVVTPREPRR